MIRLAVSASLVLALVAAAPASAWADGSAVFKEKKCDSCHYTTGPAREKSIADQLAKKGPELWYAGSKFQKPWLQAWLQNPQPIRNLKYNSLTEKNGNDHPKLSAGDATAVTDFLMGLRSSAVKPGIITANDNATGKTMFLKLLPCSVCHQYTNRRGTVYGGLSGPSLANAVNRLNPDWIYAYMTNIKTFKPFRDMPDLARSMSDADARSLAAYVASFKAARKVSE